jgi:catechol 2,3-dioxygenase
MPDQLPYGIPPPAYRLPDATRPGAVHLQVSDLARSIAYYEGVIGLRPRDVTAGSAGLHVDGVGPPLLTLHTRAGVTRARRGAFGLYHFAILLPDRAALGRFAAHLASSGVRAGMADHLVSEALYLWDPDGLGIEVYADRPRDRWQQHGRELAMTTDPLDVDDLIAAGAGERWTGTPGGTVMGHVHLHVGSLAEGEAFYHQALGLDKMVWSYPGALFLAAGGYHHHLGTNVWAPGPAPAEHEARLLAWDLVLPSADDVSRAAGSLRASSHTVDEDVGGVAAADPWGTRVRIISEYP